MVISEVRERQTRSQTRRTRRSAPHEDHHQVNNYTGRESAPELSTEILTATAKRVQKEYANHQRNIVDEGLKQVPQTPERRDTGREKPRQPALKRTRRMLSPEQEAIADRLNANLRNSLMRLAERKGAPDAQAVVNDAILHAALHTTDMQEAEKNATNKVKQLTVEQQRAWLGTTKHVDTKQLTRPAHASLEYDQHGAYNIPDNHSNDPEKLAVQRETFEETKHLIEAAHLSPTQKIYLLEREAGFTIEEIAERHNVPHNSVKVQITHARKKMRGAKSAHNAAIEKRGLTQNN